MHGNILAHKAKHDIIRLEIISQRIQKLFRVVPKRWKRQMTNYNSAFHDASVVIAGLANLLLHMLYRRYGCIIIIACA